MISGRLGVVSGALAAAGFRLAGLDPIVAEDPQSAQVVLAGMTAKAGWGAVLVQANLLPRGGAAAGPDLPMIIPFPAPTAERPVGDAERFVTELLSSAVGYRVRIQ